MMTEHKPGRGRSSSPDNSIGICWLIAIFVLAMAYRAASFHTIGDNALLRHPTIDSGYHHEWARRIVGGDWLGHGPDDVFKPPLYAYFLAGLYACAGPHVAVVQWVQMTIGALSCVLTALLAGGLLGARAGRTAGLISAFYAPYVFFELQLLTPALSILLNTAALLLLVCARPGRHYYGTLGSAGLLVGISAGIRPDVLIPAALTVLLVVSAEEGEPVLRRWGGIACITAGALAILIPIMVRNYHLTREFIPVSSNAGINLYIGNVAKDGTTAVPVGVRWERLVSQVPQTTLENPRETSRFWTHLAVRKMKQSPGQTAKRIARKMLAFFNAHEFRNNIDFHFLQRSCWPLRLPFLQYAVILPLAVLGLASLGRGTRQERRAMALCLAWVGAYFAISVVFFVNARFRLPAIPMVIVPAAHGLGCVADSLRQKRSGPLATAAAIVLVTGVVCWPSWLGRSGSDWVRDYTNLGNSLRSAHESEQAEQAYRRALALNPNDPDANLNLGKLLRAREPHQALPYLEAAQDVVQDSPDILLEVAQAQLALGHRSKAKQSLQALLELEQECNLHPKRMVWAMAYVLLAGLTPEKSTEYWHHAWEIDPRTAAEARFMQRKEMERVLTTFRSLAEELPWNWYNQANLGMALLALGKARDAVEPLRHAARLAPEREVLRFHLARSLVQSGTEEEATRILHDLRRSLPPCRLRRDVLQLLSSTHRGSLHSQ